MMLEEFSELSDLDVDEESIEDASDERMPETYYGMEGTKDGLIIEANQLIIENLISDPSESDIFYFNLVKRQLFDVQEMGRVCTSLLQRVFSITVDDSDYKQQAASVKIFLDDKYAGLTKQLGFCRKYLKKSMGFGYVCVECMSHNKNGFVCADCFKHSDHVGHKVIKLSSNGVCDCGDFDNARFPKANCSKHRGDIPIDDVTDAITKQKFKDELQSLVLVIYSMLEVLDHALKPGLGTVLVNDVFVGLQELTQRNPALVSLVSGSLMEGLGSEHRYKLLNLSCLSQFQPPQSQTRHPTNVQLSAVESEAKSGTVFTVVEPVTDKNPEIAVAAIDEQINTETPVQQKESEPIKMEESVSAPVEVRAHSLLDVIFSHCLQLHVAQSKKMVELLVHFSLVPAFKAQASVSWMLNLPRLFSPNFSGDELEDADKYICPLFDLCDQFLVDGSALCELFERNPPTHWIHFMSATWEKMLKICESYIVQFLDKRLWEDFLIDVLDSVLANKKWNFILMQKEQFIKALIRFFVNCYHCSISLPTSRPADDTVTLLSFVSHQGMDFQATSLTFFGKMMSRIILFSNDDRTRIVSLLKQVIQDELMPYRKFRCGVLTVKAGIDLSVFRLLTLVCCVERFFETKSLQSGNYSSSVNLIPHFKQELKLLEDQLRRGVFTIPVVDMVGDRKFSQLLFVESSRVYGFSKQLASGVWSFMGDTSEMIYQEYQNKCLDILDRLSMQLSALELTPAFVFFCTASRFLLPPIPKEPKPNEPNQSDTVMPKESSQSTEVPNGVEEHKPTLPEAGQTKCILPNVRLRGANYLSEPNSKETDQTGSVDGCWTEIPVELTELAFTKEEAKFGLHEFDHFFWYHEHKFKTSDWNKRLSLQTKAILLADYFNVLYLTYTDEYALSFVCEALQSELKDSSTSASVSTESRFYSEFIKQEFTAIILALSPLSVPDLLEEAQFLTPDKDLLENLIDELCEVDTETHVVRLKQRVEELAKERLDLSCASYKSNTHSKLMEGWSSKIDKKHIDKLRVRDLSAASPFTRLLRYKLGSAWPWDVWVATVGICRLVPDWKKVVGPLSAMLKFVIQYLESFGSIALQLRDHHRKLAFEWFVTNLLVYLESEVKSSPLLKSFRSKVTILREKYFCYGSVDTTQSKDRVEEMQLEALEEETNVQNQTKADDHIRERFLLKKKQAFARIKSRQSHFVSELDNNQTASSVERSGSSKEVLECAVTKEKISNSDVYYLHTQLHFTNLVGEATKNSLSLIAQDTENTKPSDLEAAINLVDSLGSQRHLLEDIMITCCGHLIKSQESASQTTIEMYEQIERPCAICKKPANLMLPMFPVEVHFQLRAGIPKPVGELDLEGFIENLKEFESVTASESPISDSIMKAYRHDESNQESGIHFELPKSIMTHNLQTEWDGLWKKELISNCRKISTAATTDMLDFYKHFVSLRGKIIGDCLSHHHPSDVEKYSVLDWSWGNPEMAPIYQVSPLAVVSWILTSNIRYMELKGFGVTARNMGHIMHSLFTIQQLTSTGDASTLHKRARLMLGGLRNLLHNSEPDRTKFEIALLVTLSTIVPASMYDGLFRQIVNFLVDTHLQIHLDELQLNRKWEDIRYDQAHSGLVNSMLRLLRSAALVQYAAKYPLYQTSTGKLFDKLVDYNMKGDSKELEYLFLFLGISTPNTLQDARHRIAEMENQLGLPINDVMVHDTAAIQRLRFETKLITGLANYVVSFGRLPSQLRALYDKYLFEACDKCGWRRHLLCCLICGAKWCHKRCHPDSTHKGLVTCGNATTHSMLQHNGTCAFVDCNTGNILVFEGNRLNIYTDVYKDKFGLAATNLTDPDLALEKYELRDEKFTEIKGLLLNQEVVQTIILRGLTEEAFFQRNLI